MPQIGLPHVPDGPEMNLEQAMPHKFQADGPGVIGSDLCQVCGKEQAEHITPPAGEKNRSTQDGEMEAAPVTGQSPVGAASPAPAEEVGALIERLNNRARQLDNAGDGLGYYSKGDAALDRELAVALSRLQAENDEAWETAKERRDLAYETQVKLTAAEQRERALREALEPFAAIAPLVEYTDVRDGETVLRLRNRDAGKYETLVRDHFRRARATLDAPKGDANG